MVDRGEREEGCILRKAAFLRLQSVHVIGVTGMMKVMIKVMMNAMMK